jgi:hypothetical protein
MIFYFKTHVIRPKHFRVVLTTPFLRGGDFREFNRRNLLLPSSTLDDHYIIGPSNHCKCQHISYFRRLYDDLMGSPIGTRPASSLGPLVDYWIQPLRNLFLDHQKNSHVIVAMLPKRYFFSSGCNNLLKFSENDDKYHNYFLYLANLLVKKFPVLFILFTYFVSLVLGIYCDLSNN